MQLCSITHKGVENNLTKLFQIPSGALYHVALIRIVVSENTSPPSSRFLRAKGFHSCVTVQSLLISLSIEGYNL
jgi:hypothetical protein